MSDRIAVFHEGRIQQVADPKKIYERPANLFVASFIGESNRMAARLVERGSDGLCVASPRDGIALRGQAAVDCGRGAEVVIAVRPERVTVTAANAADPLQDNELPGVVEETIFLGGHVRVRLKSAIGEVVASVPIQAAAAIPPTGTRAVARWPVASTVIFPA